MAMTVSKTGYWHPDAPTRFESEDGSKRECDKCKKACVNSYTEAYTYQRPHREVLLCGPCDFARRKTDKGPLEYVAFRIPEPKTIVKPPPKKPEAKPKAREPEAKPKPKAKAKQPEPKRGRPPKGTWLPNLREIRLSQGLSQAQLAERLTFGKSQGSVQKYLSSMEMGYWRASVERAEEIARALGVRVDELREMG